MTPRKRPAAPGEPVTVRLQPMVMEALDASIEANRIGRRQTRPEAIRAGLLHRLIQDGWITDDEKPGPRLLLHREQKQRMGRTTDDDSGKFYNPKGPATEALKAMDAAIVKHRASRKLQTQRSTK